MIDTARALQFRPMLLLAAGLAVALVAMLAGEYHVAASRGARMAGAVVVSGSEPPPAPAAPAVPDPVRLEGWSREVLARPLFSPSRRPAAVATAGPERPRLAGIVLGADGGRALFAGAGDARGVVAAVGQQAGAWKVLAIDATGVRVSGPDGVKVLHPTRDSDAADAPVTETPLPAHPSILDLLRSRSLQNGMPGAAGPMPGLPPSLRPQGSPP